MINEARVVGGLKRRRILSWHLDSLPGISLGFGSGRHANQGLTCAFFAPLEVMYVHIYNACLLSKRIKKGDST